jgi:hypothetical protein
MGATSSRNFLHSWKIRIVCALLLCLGVSLVGLAAYDSFYGQAQTTSISTIARGKNMAYGVNVDMTALIPGTPYTVSTARQGDFFALAAKIGINSLRITDYRWENTGEEYSKDTWVHVFNEANHYHIRIVLLLMDGAKEYTALQQAHRLLGEYGLAHAPALWMVDLYNEPNLSDPRLMSIIREEAIYVHHMAPSIAVTIGGWKVATPGQAHKFDWQNPVDIPRFIDLVNVVSAHLYQFELGYQQGYTPQQWTQQYLDAVRKEAQHKPVLLEEFGASNGLAPTDEARPLGSLQWQAYVYQSVMREVTEEHNQGVIGALAWIAAPRQPNPNPGPTTYEGDMTGWAFLLDHGQRILPAMRVFSSPGSLPQPASP